ncbi:MAG: ABC transporter ATP-binding protein [Bryobacterales bacterium]|nr:ABC transporter ATP-binding protein [Bryobacterales bacterium]
MPDTSPIIQVRDLRKVYHSGDVPVEALRGVSLDVERGEFLAVVGPSGSGKSTLFHVLSGLTAATAGSVTIDGVDIAKLDEAGRTALRKNKVGIVFQKYNLLPTLTAEENIAIALHIADKDIAWGPEFQEVLKVLGIESRMHHKPRAMSGGEQQRVAIARAIVNTPAILLADEPTGNLDTQNSEAVLALLRDLNRKTGQTILMITHNPEAAAYANRTIRMRDGLIAA